MAPTVGRRAVLQGLASGLGLTAIPGVANASHPIHQHLEHPDRVDQAEAKANAARWKPEFLAADDFATLTNLADRIVPGASRARSAEFIDQLLAVDAVEDQRRFLKALAAFESQARARFNRRWIEITPGQQTEILTDASTGELSQPLPQPWASGQPIVYTPPPDPPPPDTLRDHFDHLRTWIAGAYYSSEIGLKELGWTGNLFWEKLPGCDHADGHSA